jgi:hypothetical protein
MVSAMLLVRRCGAVLVGVLCALASAAAASASAPATSAAIQIKPAITKPVIAPSTFRAAASGPSVLAPTARAGASVHFGAVAVRSVGFTVQRALPGRRQGKRCVKPTARSGKAARCTRYQTVGRFRYAAKTQLGVVHLRFTGRVGGRKLKPGRYRLRGIPTSSTGTPGAPVLATFRIV